MLLVLTLLLVNQKAAAADSLSGQQLQQPWWPQVVLTLQQSQLSSAGKRASRRASLRFWRQFRSTPPCDTIARNTPAIHRGQTATDLMLAFKKSAVGGKNVGETERAAMCRPLFVCSVALFCGFAKGQEPESTFNKFHLLEPSTLLTLLF